MSGRVVARRWSRSPRKRKRWRSLPEARPTRAPSATVSHSCRSANGSFSSCATDVVLATWRGLIVGAFVAHDWLPATTDNFPDREDAPGRFGFVGEEAPDELRQRYVGKRVPDEYPKAGRSEP